MRRRSSPKSKSRSARVSSPQLSPTEQRNPRSLKLDRLSATGAVRLMLQEEARVPRVLLHAEKKLARAVELVAHALGKGGRLIYVGAGTSGRLGVLDASECPPTFRTPPDLVQGIIAGGDGALRRSIEGAEDDLAAGAQAMRARKLTRRDVVLGIAASGTTPVVWGALLEAKRRGARTILLCFNPHLSIPPAWKPDQLLAFDLGPEVLTGSTRLKCGTATKLVLNLLTTLTMVRLGKVMSNLMVDVAPTNAKLRQRAIRIVSTLTGLAPARVETELPRHRWNIRETVRALRPVASSRPV